MTLQIRFPETAGRDYAAVTSDIDAVIAAIRQSAGVGLHLGAGSTRIPGMINCDVFDESADRHVDCTNLREFADASVDLIETHHMIEHLSFSEVESALREWSRVLKPAGRLLVTCPDLTSVARNWLKLAEMHREQPCTEQRREALKMFYGSQDHAGMFHKNGFDEARMRETLSAYGFAVEFSFTPYPPRPTPSLLTIAIKGGGPGETV